MRPGLIFGGMDMMPYEDFDMLEARVREMVREHGLPPEVSRVEVEFGDLHDGDPAVWIELFIRDEPPIDQIDGRFWADLVIGLSQGARQIVPGRSASTRIRLDPQP